MSISQFSFSKKQLNRLFPLYILINKDLFIEDCATEIEKLCEDCTAGSFADHFILDKNSPDVLTFDFLKSLNSQSVNFKVKHSTEYTINGNIEVLEAENQILFTGTSYDLATTDLASVPASSKEEQLRTLSTIAEININTIIITDNEDKITWVNKSFSEMTGYTFEEALGKKPEHLLNGENTSQATLDYLNSQVKKGLAFNADIYNYSKSGKPYWARVKGQPIHNQNGELTGFFALIEDFTKEKEAQELLKESENRFRLALEKIGNVWEHDFRTGKTIFSKTNNEFWGYSDDDLVANEVVWWDKVQKEDFHLLFENFKKYKRGQIDSHNEEYRIIHKNGDVKWVLDRGVVIEKDENGKPLRIVGTHTDITPIKKTELELEQHVRQFRSLSENIPGVIYEYEYREDGTDGLRYISPAVERVFGITAEEFWNGKYISPIDQARIDRKQQHSRTTLEPFYDESEITIPGLDTRWYAVHSAYSYTSQDNAKVFTGFMADITERKTVEESLRVNEEKYRSILANMKLGMVEVDNDGYITYANNSFCHMCGFTIPELIGKSAGDMFLSPEKGYLEQDNLKKRQDGIADAYEVETKNKNGEKKWWLVSGAPRYNDKSELVGSIGIHLDITDQKLQEIELIAARNEAEDLAATKETFLANMSHEMRTPMNAIMSMTNQLAKTDLGTEQEFYLETIQKASKSLLVIINDVLDLSKIDAGKLSLENIGFNLVDVLQNSMQVITHKGEQKGLDLNNYYFDSKIAPVLIGDPYRINQVLLNLMTNAVKFTEKGSVDLSCKVVTDKLNSQVIEVSVKDTGIGMEKSFVTHLFDKFSQEYESVSRKYGGTGLGMSICKNLIKQMGGEIFVESVKNVGSTISFVLELPKGVAEDMPEKVVTEFSEEFLLGRKILITDDNDLNRLVASILLLDFGATVMVAENGLMALDMIANDQFDVVLMDIQMPIMNGYETTRRLREMGNHIPIIALTASAIKGEREKCIAAGMNDYITKPIDEETFLKTIDKWINKDEDAQLEDGPKMEEPLYNLSSLRVISKGREDFVKKMVDMFCEQMPPMVNELKEAYESHNLEHMGSVAHKLKSSIDHLNMTTIQRVIRDIEGFGNERINDPSLEDAIKNVGETVNAVISMLKVEFPSEATEA
ncbi:PAS domain S-box protein [Pedobacter fastidiosus]|uniref:histidine kinase n=1 Tax=Pedobacter fastidiosus TaxID=2765361 RepID=A0ABR7KLQ1_9SPHI|nr:PAS domain-containing hybrid sensor histidine kinase/response regulator [Pedobacter fastidiosus]MBC6108990.1 PAS domain S-box protein [Pedobacter fastidiosus]